MLYFSFIKCCISHGSSVVFLAGGVVFLSEGQLNFSPARAQLQVDGAGLGRPDVGKLWKGRG